MSIKDPFIAELQNESRLTRKMLERVPMEKTDWRPHPKSFTLGRLATHVAEIPSWISKVITIDDYDFVTQGYKSNVASGGDELLQIFEESLAKALADLSSMSDDDFSREWSVSRSGQLMFRTKKDLAIRGWGYSHLFHHRGQLSVYLRLLDVPVPGMYGPSADER